MAFSSTYIIVVSFLRGVILARLLGPTDFGVAIILLTIAAGLDLLSDGGVDQYLVRSRYGHRRKILAGVQSFRLATTTVWGLLLFAVAPWLATALSAPQAAWAMQWLVGAIILRGFVNLSYKIEQRQRLYGKEVRIDIVRTSAEIIVLSIAAIQLESYWAVVIGYYANSLVALAISHSLAPRRFSLELDSRIIALIGRFCFPILFNAGILFAAIQGDRLLIAAAINPLQLGLYAAACTIGQAAVALASRVTNSMALPLFGAGKHLDPQRQRASDRLIRVYCAVALLFGGGLTAIAPLLVPLIYGPAFSGLGTIIFASACVQMFQLQQTLLSSLMVSIGETRMFPLITGVRAAALPAAFPLLAHSGNVLVVPCALAVGTFIALLISLRILRRFGLVSVSTTILCLAQGLLVLGLLFAVVFNWG